MYSNPCNRVQFIETKQMIYKQKNVKEKTIKL